MTRGGTFPPVQQMHIPNRPRSAFAPARRIGGQFIRVAVFGFLLPSGAPAALAQLPSGYVTYKPVTKIIQGNQPLVAWASPDVSAPVNPYYLTITAPATGVAFPYTVTLSFSILQTTDSTDQRVLWKPAAVTEDKALSFVSATPATLTFTGPNQSRQTMIAVNVPAGSYAGAYGWGIKGNWPETVVDDGATINATVFPEIVNPNVPPVVSITRPSHGQTFDYHEGAPIQFPVEYSAMVPEGGLPLTSLQLLFDDVPVAPSSPPVLGGFVATASATSPGIVDGGVHTIRALAQNNSGGGEKLIQINVQAPPRILKQPVSQTVFIGDAVTLAVVASGWPEINYQWQKGGAEISGATNSTLAIAGARLADAGDYRVVLRNPLASEGIMSDVAHLTVRAVDPIGGRVYFDANLNRTFDATRGEIGLADVAVELRNSANQPIADTRTDASGSYSFAVSIPADVSPCYVVISGPAGLVPTTENELEIIFNGGTVRHDTGFTLNRSALRRMKANGFTTGYWSNNLEKALAGKTAGVQVSKATLEAHTNLIRGYALARFHDLTPAFAASLMTRTSSAPTDLLAKQLVAAEYNVANGAWLDNASDDTLTQLFIHWGEYILTNSTEFTPAYIIWAKDWFDAYNNSHGGLVKGPAEF